MAKQAKRNEKRLAVDLNPEFIIELKRRAVVQGISLKDWVVAALVDKIKKDTDLGWK